METKEKTKTFDAVKMMREIRDKISDETQNMTLDQLKKYIADRLKQSHLKTTAEAQTLGARRGQENSEI